MVCDLERVFGALADLVPEHDEVEDVEEDDEETEIVLNAENPPLPPAELQTDDLALTWG